MTPRLVRQASCPVNSARASEDCARYDVTIKRWAPQELRSFYENWRNDSKGLDTKHPSEPELQERLKRSGYRTFHCWRQTTYFRQQMLSRLLSDDRMRPIWKAVRENESRRQRAQEDLSEHRRKQPTDAYEIWQHADNVAEGWHREPFRPVAEIKEDLLEIQSLASRLANKLAYRRADIGLVVRYTELVEDRYERNFRRVLDPAVAERLRLSSLLGNQVNSRNILNEMLPPIHELVSVLAVKASEAAANPRKPPIRKLKAASALRTFLIAQMGLRFARYDLCQPSLVATFVAVALDDPQVTGEIVRKQFATPQWRNELEAQMELKMWDEAMLEMFHEAMNEASEAEDLG